MIKLRGTVWWSDYYTPDGKRVRKTLKTSDRDVAMARVAQMMGSDSKPSQAHSSGSYGPTLAEAFKTAMEDWDKWRESKSPTTLDGNWRAVRDHFGADTRLSEIDSRSMKDFSKAMREKNLSGSTINQRLSFVSVLFKCAVDDYDRLSIPLIKRAAPGKGRTRRISREEEATVLDWFGKGIRPLHADMADLVIVLADTGMRLSEALRLTDKAYSLVERAIFIYENKADHPRAVPMTERVYDVLARREHLTCPFGMLTVDSSNHEWQWVRSKMNLDTDSEFVMHTLRHTTGSRLADAGVDAFRIQKLLGHKSINTTQKYIHVSTAGLADLASVLGKGAKNPRAQACLQSATRELYEKLEVPR